MDKFYLGTYFISSLMLGEDIKLNQSRKF